MIESRYSIEYIDPNSEKSSSKLGRFFIYSTLILSILIATTAIIFSNLPENTSQVISNKVQQFISSIGNQPSKKVVVAPETKTPLISTEEQNTQADKETKKEEVIQQELVTTQLEDEYKKEIERLSQENTKQHDKSVKQSTENQLLAKKLKVLSEQLNNEKQKSSQLKNKVNALLIENKNVSKLLVKTEDSTKNYANNLENLENKKKKIETFIQPVTTKAIIIKAIDIEKIEPKLVTTKDTDKSKEKPLANDKIKTPISQIDAIVAAMEAANNKTEEATSNNQ